jgi:C-terminal processing protease CtpA/Prc
LIARLPTLDTATLDQVSDDDSLALFGSFENARVLDVDVRFNRGGNELHARRLAARFVRDPALHGYTRTRSHG